MLSKIRQAGGEGSEASHYTDNTVDFLFQPDAAVEPGSGRWSWPDGKGCGLVLSHDVDTQGQEQGIGMMRSVALRHGISHTFSFVGRFLADYQDTLDSLRVDGVDIALHDVSHDNQVAFLSEEAIVERLSSVSHFLQRWQIKGFRSPSWYLSPTLWAALNEMGFLYDMSALDSWSFFTAQKTHGVRTFYPFMYENLVVLPNTIPFELPWYCGYAVQDTLAFWKPKVDQIARAGGLIMINAHPDRWYCGNKPAARALDQLLDYIISQHDPVAMSGSGLALHMRKMRDQQCVMTLPGSPELRLPQLQPGQRQELPTDCNPLLTERRRFLLKNGCLT
jgi:peptidoglycan/xylan/chitin deacetylase (PgdA/CDA1 family)